MARTCLTATLLLLATLARLAVANDDAARLSLARAADYLWSQQAEDGGWHSPQYGVLRSGQALTPFVLHTLLNVPHSIAARPRGGEDRALEFIRRHIDKSGAIGRADPDVLEYPVYSTAYALLCFKQVRYERGGLDAADDKLIDRMAGFLTAAQFDEAEEFTPRDPAYGGWGFDVAKGPGVSGHMDLAHTRRALESLAPPPLKVGVRGGISAVVKDDHAASRAESFLRLLQKHPDAQARVLLPPEHADASQVEPSPFDGGFYFSPVILAANKGRLEDAHWQSYATATCDGVLALLAAGVPRDDERVTAAAAWLQSHGDLDYPDGVPTDHPEPWGEAIRFYHYAVRAEAYRRLDFSAAERARLAVAVAARQRDDGSFVNDDSPLMKEDDPLLCTALAAISLLHALP